MTRYDMIYLLTAIG